jgi:hypothetical protein
MRDIRGDLQDRAALLEEQINAHQAQFDKLIDQLKREHDARLEEIKSELEAVNRLMEVELRRLGAVQQAPAQARGQMHSQPQSHPQQAQAHSQHQGHQNHPHQQSHQPPQQQPQQPLADFLVRKLSEVGALSRDDLRRLAVQEGYFPDGESAERGVHATLLNVAKAGLVRQLPNGNFAPATVLDTIRLRRAI